MNRFVVLAGALMACLVSYADVSTYSITLSVSGIPEDNPAYHHFTSDTTYTFYDGSGNIVAYVKGSEAGKASVAHSGTYAHTLYNPTVSLLFGTLDVNSAIVATSDSALRTILGNIPQGTGNMAGWYAIVSGYLANEDESTTVAYSQTFNTVGYNNTAGTKPNFQAGGAFVAPIPEPTSGLLMLLGMAGLALRRRRA